MQIDRNMEFGEIKRMNLLQYLRESIKEESFKILRVGEEACPTTVAANKILNQQGYKRPCVRDDIP